MGLTNQLAYAPNGTTQNATLWELAFPTGAPEF